MRFGNVLGSRGSVIPTFLRLRLSGLEEGVDVDITYSGVRPNTAELIETLIQSALADPDNWDALRIQLHALVPDFHVPPPPPPTEDSDVPAAAVSGERKLHLA